MEATGPSASKATFSLSSDSVVIQPGDSAIVTLLVEPNQPWNEIDLAAVNVKGVEL